ncbi:MAG: reverse transcriptase domain-containing protein, partial [Propionibacteriaceae bacterium]
MFENPFEGHLHQEPLRLEVVDLQEGVRLSPSLLKPPNNLQVLQTTVGARLLEFAEVWAQKGADPWTLSILRRGYLIPFVERPPLTTIPRELTARYRDPIMNQALHLAVDQMLEKGAIELVTDHHSSGFYNRLFLVPKSSGGWRPVLDVSALNFFVEKKKFTMETPSSVLAALRPGDWMVSLDLQDAYFHVPIHPSSRKFLRFMMGGKIFQFRALCFGLSTAPQVFTGILRNVAQWLHLKGVRISMYLDDWLIRANSEDRCLKDLQVTLELTKALGLLVNFKKSSLIPEQECVYLGIQMNSLSFRAFPSQERIARGFERVTTFLGKEVCTVREWMSLLGTLSSLEQFVSLGRLHLRPLQFFLHRNWSRRSQDLTFSLSLSQDIKKHLLWWTDPNLFAKGLSLQSQTPNLVLFSDASDMGWGA